MHKEKNKITIEIRQRITLTHVKFRLSQTNQQH